MSLVKSPVEAAVEPLKIDAIAYAEKITQERIDKVLAQLAAVGNDAEKYAPYPRNTNVPRDQYTQAVARYNFVRAITTAIEGYRWYNAPDIRVASPEGIAKAIDDAKYEAALQYDVFVAKLNAKIGECDSATLEGSHVWGSSVLTVTKGDAVEFWKTQQIVNVSKLGTHYLQWPSRKVKTPR